MKLISFLALLVFTLSACEKNGKVVDSNGALHQIQFRVNALSMTTGQEIDDQAYVSDAQTSPLNSYVHCLNYLIYNSSGTLVKEKKQADSSPEFGQIKDSIASGTYTIILIGSQTDVGFSSPASLTTARIVESSPLQELFFKKLSITVSDEDIEQDLSLDRIVGYLELKADDDLPSEVASVDFVAKADYQSFSFSTAQVLNNGGTVDKKVTKVFTGSDDRKSLRMGMFVMNDLSAMSCTVTLYDSGNRILKTLKADNVLVKHNTKTTLSGKLYSAAASGFNIIVNPEWSPDSISVRL